MGTRRELFEEWAGRYDASVDESDAGSRFPFAGYEAVLQRLAQRAEPLAGRHVLELGVGTGRLTERCLAAGCLLIGVDFSHAMLVRAGERCPDAKLSWADVRRPNWALDQAACDCVVASYLFHEFPLRESLDLIEQLIDGPLESDGCVIIGDVLFPDCAARRLARTRCRDLWDDEEHYWAADELMTACQRRGLEATCEQMSFCGGVVRIRRLPSA